MSKNPVNCQITEMLHPAVRMWLQSIGVWVRSKAVRLRDAGTVQCIANMIIAFGAIFTFLAQQMSLNTVALVAEALKLAAGVVGAAAEWNAHRSTQRSTRFRPDAGQADEGGSPGLLQVSMRPPRDPNDWGDWPQTSSSRVGNRRAGTYRPPRRTDTFSIDIPS